MTEKQYLFTGPSSTIACYSIWVDSQSESDAVSFQNPRLSGGGGGSNIYVSMHSQSSTLGDGFKIPRIYMNPVVTPTDLILNVNFTNRSAGAYSDAEIKEDFHWNWNNDSAQENPIWYTDRVDLVADPADEGHGVVMRVTRPAGVGWAGMAFRADLGRPGYDDIYFAYDMYLDSGHDWMTQQKNPGFTSGPHSDSHQCTEHCFVYVPSSDGSDAWGRGEGALNIYYYDEESHPPGGGTGFGWNDFWDEVDPTLKSGSNQYNQPAGEWITIECRVKMNTINVEGVSGIKDGLSEVWVTDPTFNGGAVKKVSSITHLWRVSENKLIDAIDMSQGYGGDGNLPGNQPASQQYHYYDNFRVSTNPITH